MGKGKKARPASYDPWARYEALGVYLAERARGLTHAPEWDERMLKLLDRFNRQVADEAMEAAWCTAERLRGKIGLMMPCLEAGETYSDGLAKVLPPSGA